MPSQESYHPRAAGWSFWQSIRSRLFCTARRRSPRSQGAGAMRRLRHVRDAVRLDTLAKLRRQRGVDRRGGRLCFLCQLRVPAHRPLATGRALPDGGAFRGIRGGTPHAEWNLFFPRGGTHRIVLCFDCHSFPVDLTRPGVPPGHVPGKALATKAEGRLDLPSMVGLHWASLHAAGTDRHPENGQHQKNNEHDACTRSENVPVPSRAPMKNALPPGMVDRFVRRRNHHSFMSSYFFLSAGINSAASYRRRVRRRINVRACVLIGRSIDFLTGRLLRRTIRAQQWVSDEWIVRPVDGENGRLHVRGVDDVVET